jgi:hypothetical protein
VPNAKDAMPADKWEKLAEVVRASEPDLQRRIIHLQTDPPDPVKQPVSSALARAYVSRFSPTIVIEVCPAALRAPFW